MIAGGFVALPAAFTPATPIPLITALLLVGGFFRSLQFTSINALSYADVPPERMSRATTLTSVAQQLSLSVGISVGAIALELTHAAERRRDRGELVPARPSCRRRPSRVARSCRSCSCRATPATRCRAASRRPTP